jgi:signal transduction histidine kinase
MCFWHILKRKQNDSIHRALLSSIVVSTIILLIPITILTIYLMRVRFYDQIEYASKQVRTETMQTIKGRVEEALSYADFMEKKLEERAREQVKNRTLEAHAIATGIYQQFKDKVSLPELNKMVREALRPIRFDVGRGYYFATDFNGVEQLFADRPEMEGKNLLDMKDTDGRPVIQDLILIAKTKDEGFYEYLWTKPNQPDARHRKLSYVKRFEPFDWFIGTGLYLDDVEEDIKNEVLNRIGAMRWGEDGSLFVFQYDGVYLQHAQNKYIGQNLLHIEDPKGVRINERLVEICKSGGGFLEYVWDNCSTGQLIPKISYAKGQGNWGWVIGTGAYMEDINARQESMVAKLKTDTLIAIVTLALMAALSLMVSFVIYQRFRKKLDAQMQPILDFLLQVGFTISQGFRKKLDAQTQPILDFRSTHPENRATINIEDQQYLEFRTIALAANQFDRLWHETQDELREREKVQRLLL